MAKFQNKEKTTDDTYTPQDIYEAVLAYVRTIYPMDVKEILRPFYPGGDYERAEYPENGVVIDNPPFSIFKKICRFYSEREIPFFIFCPGLTISTCLEYCSAVVVAPTIEFSNGAKVKCGFAASTRIAPLVVRPSIASGGASSPPNGALSPLYHFTLCARVFYQRLF